MAFSVVGHAAADQTGSVVQPALMISELQTDGLHDGVVDGKQEFIELYNPGNTALDVNDWQVQYLSASNDGSSAPTRVLATLEGLVGSHGHVLLSAANYLPDADIVFADSTSNSGWLAKTGGHVRIIDSEGAIVDLLTWGSGVMIGAWWKAPEIPAGNSVQRILPEDSHYTTGLTFSVPTVVVTPEGGGLRLPVQDPTPICTGIVLSEILPNPAGSDSGNEFIEIHNASDVAVDLAGCSLRLGADGAVFPLPDESLAADAYLAFSDTITGITLPNATAQTVWLLTSTNEEGVLYPNALADNQSWARINGVWQITLRPTPNTLNAADLPATTTEASSSAVDASATLESCPAGKERNPDTNRCRSVVAVASVPAPCPDAQERNPITNRCKAISSPAANAPVACKVDQERNPQTNRCKAIAGATTEPKPCAVGQIRNPDTGRCKKDTPTATPLSKIQDVKTVAHPFSLQWWLVAAGLVVALGYGIYEWRYDIENYLYVHRLRKEKKHKNNM